jgi:ABC-type phosphate/phosphonate transport system substrate-binding protein
MKYLAPLFLIVFLVSCAENPVTRTRGFMVFPEKNEVALGNGLDKEVKVRYGVYNDEKQLKKISILNGIQEDLVLEAGRKIKLIVSSEYSDVFERIEHQQ